MSLFVCSNFLNFGKFDDVQHPHCDRELNVVIEYKSYMDFCHVVAFNSLWQCGYWPQNFTWSCDMIACCSHLKDDMMWHL